MKKLATKLMLLSTAALVMLGSCGEKQRSNDQPDSTTSENSGEVKSPTKIKHKDIPYIQEGIACNLDSYVDIEYSDGSLDKNYEVKTNSKNVTIDGHRVRSSDVGVFYVTITAGGLTTKLDITVLSQDQFKIMNFVDPLKQDARNFTVDLYAENEQGQETRLWRVVHNAKYSVNYDPDDPFALTESGDPDSWVLAKLSDGNGYSGHIEKDANNQPKAVFEPGIISSYDYYYIVMDMELNAADSSYVSIGGEDVLLMGSDFAESLMWSVGIPYAKNNSTGATIPFYGAVYMGYEDLTWAGHPADGNPDSMTFDILIGDESDYGVYCTIKLSAVGTSELSWMSDVTTNASYIPEAITSSEITTAFTAANTAGSYTLSLEAWSINAEANSLDKVTPTAAKDVEGDACANLFGTCDAVITEKHTADGIYTEFKRKKLTETATGYAHDTEYSLKDISAVWNDSGAAYSTRLDADGHLPERAAISGTTDVFTLAEVKAMAANNVTAAGCDQVNWTSKKTNGTKVTFKGDVGDNGGTSASNTTQKNLLFQQLLDMFGGANYGVLKSLTTANAYDSWGTMWTKPEEFNGGEYHALTIYSKYNSFVVDTATNEVEITFLMYAPIGFDNGYFGMKMTLSDIGTTTFDFSTLTAANENPGILA